MKILTRYTASLLLLPLTVIAQAQKLPNKQEGPVYAPVSIKIDGKLNEWGTTLKAFNRATEIYYTVANDDQFIYLAVQAKNRSIISRIINGGISFSLTAGINKRIAAPTITFPVYEPNKRPTLNIGKDFYEGSSTGINVPDSVTTTNNQVLERQSKLIFVTNIDGVDSLISVYNDNNIKVSQKFNNQLFYCYELAIPLRYFSSVLKAQALINYHVVLNGTSIFPGNKTKSLDKIAALGNAQNEIIAAKLGMEAQLNAATDFGGEYTLAKK